MSNKKFIWYFLIVGIICALPTLFLLFGHEDVQLLFVFFQVITLIIASFHLYYINEKLIWINNKLFVKKFLFTIGITLCSMMFFFLISYFLTLRSDTEYIKLFIPSLFVFILPFFVVTTFEKAIQIPPVKLKPWFPSEVKILYEPIVWNNNRQLNFKFPNFPEVKQFDIPLKDMRFGDYISISMKEWNENNPGNLIEYNDKSGNEYGWIFYIKADKWWKGKRMIDPYFTINENNIKEKEIILPKKLHIE